MTTPPGAEGAPDAGRGDRPRPELGFLALPPATADVQRLYDDDVDDVGYVMNLSRLWAQQPAAQEGLAALLGQTAGRGRAHPSPARRPDRRVCVLARRLVLRAGMGQEAGGGDRRRRGRRCAPGRRRAARPGGTGAGEVGPAGRPRPQRHRRGRRAGAAGRRVRGRRRSLRSPPTSACASPSPPSTTRSARGPTTSSPQRAGTGTRRRDVRPAGRRRRRSRPAVRPAPAARAAARTPRGSVSATAASCGDRSTSRGRHGSKPVEASTAAYQCGAQTPSLSRGPGGQCSIRSVKAMPEPVAPPAQVGLGVAQEVAGVDDRRVLAGGQQGRRAAAPAAAGRCRPAPRRHASARTTRPPRAVRGSAARRSGRRPTRHRPVGQVVAHVLLVVHRVPGRAAARAATATARSRSVSPTANTSSRPGWSIPVRARKAAYSGSSTTTVSGRFSHERISAVEMLRGPDQTASRTGRTGSVMRRPGADRAATSRATRSAYSCCSRATTGPRVPSPIRRPSTSRTGTTPANVPVQNASDAL